jgi:DNA-binding winged helix-turn-helix (wHTH) protein/pimeloyl-ACP methyl ester carboxylesterase
VPGDDDINKFRFGDCELDLDARELTRNGVEVSVEPQVFDLLVYLLRNRGRLVSHDELITAIWRGRMVSDSAIAARISAARKAVGDSGKAQQVIKTVSRKGFKFLAGVVGSPCAEGAGENVFEASRAGLRDRQIDRQEIRFCKSANGARIAYASTGEGINLVRTGHWLTHLEHDWHSPIWRPFLDRMGKNFRITRYDQRGCGLTDRELHDFSLPRFVEDLEAVIDAAGQECFVLYASSQGVPVAIEYAHRHPERVSHLVLHGGYARGRLLRDSAADREQGEAILKLIEHGWGIIGSPFLQAFTTMYIPDASREQMDSLVQLQKITTSAANATAIRRAVDSFDVTAVLPLLDVKTLVIHAANDGVQPVDQGRELAANIPRCEFVLLESSNHVILPAEPAWDRFFRELDRFIAS